MTTRTTATFASGSTPSRTWSSNSRCAPESCPPFALLEHSCSLLLVTPQRLYPSTFVLFHSEHGSPVIGGIWHPSVEAPRAFKVGLGFPARPVVDGAEGAQDGKAKVALDKKAVFREIERVGKGFVVKVEEVKR